MSFPSTEELTRFQCSFRTRVVHLRTLQLAGFALAPSRMVEPIIEWDVVVLGGINDDYVIRGRNLPGPGTSLDGDEFLAGPGGKGANAAVAAARLGARTALIGCVGADDRGRAHIAAAAAEGVHVVHISVDASSPTGAAVIHVDGRGQKQILAALGANLRLLSKLSKPAARRFNRAGCC